MPELRRTDQYTLRVLQLIRSAQMITRSEIAVATGRSGFLSSRVCDQLIEAGFISEVGTGDSTGGRRPTLLSLKPGLGRLVGIHMGTINLRFALTDFAGNLIQQHHTESLAMEGPKVALSKLMNSLQGLLDGWKVRSSELDGIGIGISAVLDSKGVILHWPRLSNWNDVSIQALIQKKYKTLIVLDDTPRTEALAELHVVSEHKSQVVMYVTLGAGAGAAVFLHGQLYKGATGYAGEIGHISVSSTGPVCSCGNRGCLEALVSASELIRVARNGVMSGLSSQLERLSQGDPQKITIEMIGEAAGAGDRFALRLLEDASLHIGNALVSAVNMFNPDLIIIGGGITSAVGDMILPWIRRTVKTYAMAQPAGHVELRLSRLDQEGPAFGATLLVAEEALRRTFVARWKDKEPVEDSA